jgi:hypothetical protein
MYNRKNKTSNVIELQHENNMLFSKVTELEAEAQEK